MIIILNKILLDNKSQKFKMQNYLIVPQILKKLYRFQPIIMIQKKTHFKEIMKK